jgi:ubiquinone/menaquinone biosynthesis C-methylase UbiE
MSAQPTQPSPLLLFDTINAYQRTAIIKAAIELDFFTAIAKGSQTSESIAEACGVAQRGARILCDCLAVMGFLTKEGESYRLTPDSRAFLDRSSPAYLGGSIEFLLSPLLAQGFEDLAGAVRKGGTTTSEEGSVAPDNPIWVSFARSMAPMTIMPAQMIVELSGLQQAPRLKVLDIAAGHGFYGIAFAQKNPNAEITALDWPGVLELARQNAGKAGVLERYKTIEGSAFDAEFGEGYDLALVTNFLHHFDAATCETLLKKVHAALAPGGRAITLEFIPNADRITPANAAMFSITMLASTPSGDAHTFQELSRMLENAGFKRSELRDLPNSIQRVVISHK